MVEVEIRCQDKHDKRRGQTWIRDDLQKGVEWGVQQALVSNSAKDKQVLLIWKTTDFKGNSHLLLMLINVLHRL
ncbi:hypothetical protein BGU14_20830 [Clostridioides difficile]|nr:hypothetical protein BGU14_20830 [Clostridioides difficile]